MKTPDIVPLPGKSNVAIVLEQLEGLIRDGFWQPEERILTEADLARKFNVGRSTIREALNTLKARNLIYTVPGQGTFVSKRDRAEDRRGFARVPDPRSWTDILNIMDLRIGIEPVNAALAARRFGSADLKEMEACHEALAAAVDDPARFAETDLAFHMLVARTARNAVILDVMAMVKDILLRQQMVTSRQLGCKTRALHFHRAIVEAIRNADPERAELLMREHMLDTYSYIKSSVEAPGSGDGFGREARTH